MHSMCFCSSGNYKPVAIISVLSAFSIGALIVLLTLIGKHYFELKATQTKGLQMISNKHRWNHVTRLQ